MSVGKFVECNNDSSTSLTTGKEYQIVGEGSAADGGAVWYVLEDDNDQEHAYSARRFSPPYDKPKALTISDNPKDAIGAAKLPLSYVPDTLKMYAAVAFAEGAAKYGAYNWRGAGVRASIYMEAAQRHMAKYWNGEEADQVTKVPHLASAIACLAIILDAELVGKLTDDRPPAADIATLIETLEPVVQHLRELHKDKNPKHYTEINKDSK